jgi:response regulator RpfG family c-di-GMP phosphodiesterase
MREQGDAGASTAAEAGMTDVTDDLDTRIHAARILVVDDNPDQLDLMELMLRKHGYTHVEVIEDPTKVAPSYAAAPYDLILLDMEMPVMNGVDVMRQLKGELKGAFMPVIVLTAHEGADVRLQALKEGARDYISKPFVDTEFAHRIRNHLEVRMLYSEREKQNEILEQKVSERTRELKETQTEILRRLAKAGEYRDTDTGNHVQRRWLPGWTSIRRKWFTWRAPCTISARSAYPTIFCSKKAVLPTTRWSSCASTSITAWIC